MTPCRVRLGMHALVIEDENLFSLLIEDHAIAVDDNDRIEHIVEQRKKGRVKRHRYVLAA